MNEAILTTDLPLPNKRQGKVRDLYDLTLPNGERISFGSNVNFIFETNDMKFASPATITRLGMIFLSEEDVDVGRVTKTWLKK